MRKLFLVCALLSIVLARNYNMYHQRDCTGNDIKQASSYDPEELKKICDETDECIGFNTHGWLKKACPGLDIQTSVDSYVLDTIVFPDGKEPDVLLWPMPSSYASGNDSVAINFLKLRFVPNHYSDELKDAVNRFKSMVFTHGFGSVPEVAITTVRIQMDKKEVDFVTTKDESYALKVPNDGSDIEIVADNIYGVYHALNSLAFLIQYDFVNDAYIIKHAPYKIEDHPFLQYRALMIDSSRHFLPIRSIKNIIDAMSWVKLNVLHWHLVDDQSFPVYFPSAPDMWKGAFTNYERYTHWDVEEVVAYAKARGVHVIPEMDVPGHAASWCKGNPEMCPSAECPTPLDPSQDTTFDTINSIFNDVAGNPEEGSDLNSGLFPGEFIHIGGDEVDTSCWGKVDRVKDWLAAQNMTQKEAYAYFINRVDGLVKKHNRQTIAWEEVYANHKDKISKEMIIQIWLGDGERLKNVVADGFRAIMSNYKHWYLPQLWETWDYYYGNDFLKDIPKEQWSLVMGGEVCMWGEWVDASDFENTIMPRAIAAAERMWTQPELLDKDVAMKRLPYIRCEYNRRGIGAAPTFRKGREAPPNPGSCMVQ